MCQKWALLYGDLQEHMEQHTWNWFLMSLFRRAVQADSRISPWNLPFFFLFQTSRINTVPSVMTNGLLHIFFYFLLESIYDNSWLSCANKYLTLRRYGRKEFQLFKFLCFPWGLIYTQTAWISVLRLMSFDNCKHSCNYHHHKKKKK